MLFGIAVVIVVIMCIIGLTVCVRGMFRPNVSALGWDDQTKIKVGVEKDSE